MKKTTIILFFSIFMSAVIFANSPYKNEVFVKGSEINMQKYVKFCKANTKIKDLYVQKYEVTREEFEEYLDYFGYNQLKEFSKDGGLFTYKNMMKYPECAAVLITFYDACKYCNWRSEREGLEPAYDIKGELPFSVEYFQWKQENGKWVYYVPKMPEIKLNQNANGYRLPTLNEYFYLLLGGEKGIEDKWWEGIDITEYEYFTSQSTARVGSLKSNPLGIYDLFSNASEWIFGELNSFYEDDPVNTVKNAIGYSLKKNSLQDFNLLQYFSNKKTLSPVSPLVRGFIGMRMVRNAE